MTPADGRPRSPGRSGPGTRAARVSWCVFDWANSAFPTVIVTFAFPHYFVEHIVGDRIAGTAQWGYAVAASGLAVAVLAPLLGSVADSAGRRKPWLAAFTAATVACAAALWLARPDPSAALMVMALFVAANVAFELGQAFYNAILPEIAPPGRYGRLSGWGWGLGYAGGLCSLAALLFGFILPGTPAAGALAATPLGAVLPDAPLLGLSRDALEPERAMGPFVAAWFALFCLPLFVFVPDGRPRALGWWRTAREGVASLVSTVRRVRDHRDIAWFLAARMLYVDGMNTLFAFGGVYAGQTFGMSTLDVLLFGIAINVAAGLGAAGFAWLDDRLGPKATIALSLAGLIALGVPALLAGSLAWFLAFAVPLGLFVGPAQSASRSMMAHMAPASCRTEMFGLLAFSGRATAYVGPFVLATVTALSGSQPLGMATILVFLAAGLAILLWKVRPAG